MSQNLFALFLHSFKKPLESKKDFLDENDSVAQLVEQYTFNVWVLGSSPSRITKPQIGLGLFSFMAYMYILYSEKLKKYYIGACIDIDRRLYEHNIGHSKFTSTGIPWILKHQEFFDTLQEAKKRETYIKKMKSSKYIHKLIEGR